MTKQTARILIIVLPLMLLAAAIIDLNGQQPITESRDYRNLYDDYDDFNNGEPSPNKQLSSKQIFYYVLHIVFLIIIAGGFFYFLFRFLPALGYIAVVISAGGLLIRLVSRGKSLLHIDIIILICGIVFAYLHYIKESD